MTIDDFDRLYESYVTGNLDTAEATQLKEALRDPVWQKRWRDNSDVDGALLEEFRVQTASDATQATGKLKRRKSSRKQTTARRARWWPALAAAAILLVAGYLALPYFLQSSPVAEVVFISEATGTAATLTGANGTPQALRQGMKISSGSSLATGAFVVRVKYAGETTTVEGLANTTIAFSTHDEAKRLTLEGGGMKADVSKQPAGKSMVILTSRASIEVKGTRFELTHSAGSTRVDMEEGVVKVARLSDGRSLNVKAGEYAEVAEGAQFAALPRVSNINLVSNPGFEEDGAGWEIQPESTIVFTRSGLHGSKAAEIKNGKAVRELKQRVPVQAGETYRVSVWAKLQDLHGSQGGPLSTAIQIFWLDAQQKQLRRDQRNSATGTQDWKQLSGEFAAPPQATHALIRLFAEDGLGTFWFDDCEFVRVQK